MATTKELMEIQTALRNGKVLSDQQVAKIADVRRAHNADKSWISVEKLDLRDGEELWDFANVMASAVQTDRIVLADGSLDARLHGIFDDHVIVQDGNTGRFFKSEYSRDASGEISFSEPQEVVPAFIPAKSNDEESADKVSKSVGPRFVDVSKALQGKWGFLPGSLRTVAGRR